MSYITANERELIIRRIMDKLKKLWLLYPDQRLGQLIENYVIPSGAMRGPNTVWIYMTEDDQTEKNLDAVIEADIK